MVTGNQFLGRVWIYRGKPLETPNIYLLILVKKWAGLGKSRNGQQGHNSFNAGADEHKGKSQMLREGRQKNLIIKSKTP
jgi:hypothetical protein